MTQPLAKGRFAPTEPLKGCPFCASDQLQCSWHDGAFPYVICEKCGGQSGFARNPDEACKNWNRRRL
jgi:Zn ribbon nucleic-acid-binding protein